MMAATEFRDIGDRRYTLYKKALDCPLPTGQQVYEFFWDDFARLYYYDISGCKLGFAMELGTFDDYLDHARNNGYTIRIENSAATHKNYIICSSESAVLEQDQIEDIQKKIAEAEDSVKRVYSDAREKSLGWGRPIPKMNADATRDDREKPRTDLLDASSMLGVADVLTFGAKKYAVNNWKKGFVWGRIISSMLRHLFAFMRGEDIDPESGLPHVDHIACNAMFLQWHYRNRKDLDDRYVETKEAP